MKRVETESIENMRKVKQLNPTAFILQLFFNAKADEIASIYSNAFQDEKNRIYKLQLRLTLLTSINTIR